MLVSLSISIIIFVHSFKDTKQHVNISGGPLAYRYQFEEIYIHYGIENSQGSEHKIGGTNFPGEVSISNKRLLFPTLC